MDFTTINGYEFEDYVSNILRNMGFEIEQTTYSNDGGIDIIANFNKPIFSGRYIVQCKNWQGNVGAPEIRDLYGVVMDQRANKGILITPSDFTEQAYEFAKGKNIELINGDILTKLAEKTGNIKKENTIVDFPEDFNKTRYEYLKSKILNDSRVTTTYKEMDDFLLEYILNDNHSRISIKVIDELIKNKEDLIKKCYNTKSKVQYKNIELINKAVYCLLGGYIEEALEISLDKDGLRKYLAGIPYEREVRNSFYKLSAEYGDDCLTRNLYIVFRYLNYLNGLRIIDEKTNLKFNFFTNSVMSDSDIPKVSRYMNWTETSYLYIPSFYSSKYGKQINRYNLVLNENCIDIEKLDFLKLKNKDELFKKLDLIISQHGL